MNRGSSESLVLQSLKEVGVEPSPAWLQNCFRAMTGKVQCTADTVLRQLVQHDIRDVVRHGENGSDSEHLPQATQQLRNAIQDSSKGFVQLPTTFKLLVQVEELVDVSRNAEDRLKGNSPSHTNAGRCLKLVLSDGTIPRAARHGLRLSSTTCNSSQPPHIIAIESSPVRALSVSTLAGTKICIHGSVRIRHGMLLLSEKHVTVLGGNVPRLVNIQKQAMEKARHQAGVGVDPTVRALVRDDALSPTEPDDEGEHESRDVTVAPQLVPPPMAQQVPMQRRLSTQPASNSQRRNLSPLVAGTASTSATPVAIQNQQTSLDIVTPATVILPQSSPNETSPSFAAEGSTPMSDNVGPSRTASAVAPMKLPFPQFLEFLKRVLGSETLYHQNKSKTFFIELRQHGPKMEFGIVKNPEFKRGSNGKHVYNMIARFHGSAESGGLITCKISSSVMEPFFEKSPSEMRKLNKEDRSRAAPLVMEGGAKLQKSLNLVHTYQVRLCASALSSTSVDGSSPVVELIRQL